MYITIHGYVFRTPYGYVRIQTLTFFGRSPVIVIVEGGSKRGRKISRISSFIIIYFIPCHLPLRYGQSAHYISYLRTSDVKPVILR